MSTADQTTAQLNRAGELLELDQPSAAEEVLRELLESDPENLKARRVLGFAYLQQHRHEEAIAEFEGLFESTNKNPVCALDLAKALSQAGDLDRAGETLREVLESVPTLTPGWYLLGDIRVEQRKFELAREAFGEAVANDPFRVQIDQCKRSIQENDIAKVERILRHILEQDPLHVEALAGMEVLALGSEEWIEAEDLFARIQQRTRYWPTLLLGLSQLFLMTDRSQEAVETLMSLVEIEPGNILAWNMLGTANELLMNNEAAIAAFEHSLQLEPNQPRAHVSIGNIQRVIGNREASERAFEDALRFTGMNGEAYWGLSNLKTYEFSDRQIADMRDSLDQDDTSLHNAAPMFFALAKAYEDHEDYSGAFAYYCKGNAIQKYHSAFDSGLFHKEIGRISSVFDKALFERFSNNGDYTECAEAPIFIVGMPRTGSTLVEQILAAHSQIDATMELPFVEQYVREISSRKQELGPYPESVKKFEAKDISHFAERYLRSAEHYRDGAPRFTDKMPNNFVHIGLIHLMFPQAVFIDVSRNPMDTCVSVFKQRFAIGQPFSYSLEDIAHYYIGYRRLMKHWESVLPGSIHRVLYEDLVTDPDTEIRKLINFAGLELESHCLSPELNTRAIRTPSSEQVRQPITDRRIGYWRNFEAHLRSTQHMLKDEIDAYEDARST